MTKLQRQIQAECAALGSLHVQVADLQRAIAQRMASIAALRAKLPAPPAPKAKKGR